MIKTFSQFNEQYSTNFPLIKQSVISADDTKDNEYYAGENKFQEVQEHMKYFLKPIILRKNKNADDNDVEKVMESFFKLGGNKSQEIKTMVDNCKDTKQCAKDIIDKYMRYVKINFNLKDQNNDVESTL